jgi:hypothetical protein
MTSLDEVIEATLLNIENYKKHIKKAEKTLAEARRKKWWLEHPEVAYFTARIRWETNYGHSEWEQELSFYVDSVTGIDGFQLDFHNRGWFDHYPLLEEEAHDDYELKTYRNPFLCT